MKQIRNFFTLFLILLLLLIIFSRPKPVSSLLNEIEELTYSIYYKKIKIGKAVLAFQGVKNMQGGELYHIRFRTNIPGFEDVEDIYADQETFLPQVVYRQINQIGNFPVKIREEYDQQAFSVKIKKQGKFLSKEFIIQKDSPIHNPILLTYYYRNKFNFREEKSLKVTLPKASFNLLFKGKEVIETPLGEYQAYLFNSPSAKFAFWLSADEKKLPLKIESCNLLGYSLILESIKE